MRHFLLTVVLLISFCVSSAYAEYDRRTMPLPSEEDAEYVYSESGGGGLLPVSAGKRAVNSMSLRYKAASRAESGYVGSVTVNKLVYYIFDFGIILDKEPGVDFVATLMGWADSYDYYPDLVVPDWVRYDGKKIPVTAVNNYAFVSGWGLKSLKLGKNVGLIGPHAFQGCGFPEVTIPYSTCFIWNSAFYFSSLRKVIFKNASARKPALYIGPAAFSACLLTEFELPARARIYYNGTLTFWWTHDSFLNLNPLKKVTINECYNKRGPARVEDADWGYDEDPNDEEYQGEEDTADAENGLSFEIIDNALCVVKTDKDGNGEINIVTYPQEADATTFTAEGDCINLWEQSMSSARNLESVNLTATGNSTKPTIIAGANSLSGCSSLKTLELKASNGNMSLTEGFIADCPSLENINMGENSNYSTTDNVIYYTDNGKRKLFSYPAGKSDREFTVPADVEYINPSAFKGASNLGRINLPDNLKGIGDYAFASCTKLADILYNGQTLDFIGLNAFYNTAFMPAGSDGATIWNGWLLGYGNTPENLVLGNEFSHIANGALMSHYNLRSVEFTSALNEIPDNCFSECVLLEDIKWPASLEKIGVEAFRSSGLKGITIPQGVTSIGSLAFAWTKPDRIFIPSSVKEIGNYAFSLDVAPSEIIVDMTELPDLLKDDYAIFDNETLTNSTLVIPEGVNPIEFTSAPAWKFAKVVNRKLDSIADIAPCTSIIKRNGNTVSASDGSEISIYGIDGTLIGKGRSVTVATRGIYLLVTGNTITKTIF